MTEERSFVRVRDASTWLVTKTGSIWLGSEDAD